MKTYNRKRGEMNTHARTYARTYARTHTHTHTHTLVLKVKKGLTETRTRIKEKKYLYLIRLTLMYFCLPTELQRKLSKLLKVTYIIMIMYYVTPMIPLYNGFYLFPLSRAVNSNRPIFDPSEFEIRQCHNFLTIKYILVHNYFHIIYIFKYIYFNTMIIFRGH